MKRVSCVLCGGILVWASASACSSEGASPSGRSGGSADISAPRPGGSSGMGGSSGSSGASSGSAKVSFKLKRVQ